MNIFACFSIIGKRWRICIISPRIACSAQLNSISFYRFRSFCAWCAFCLCKIPICIQHESIVACQAFNLSSSISISILFFVIVKNNIIRAFCIDGIYKIICSSDCFFFCQLIPRPAICAEIITVIPCPNCNVAFCGYSAFSNFQIHLCCLCRKDCHQSKQQRKSKFFHNSKILIFSICILPNYGAHFPHAP